jgi:hypothetical protein
MFAGAVFVEIEFTEDLFFDVWVGIGGDYL